MSMTRRRFLRSAATALSTIPPLAGIYSPSLSLRDGEVTGQSRTTPGPIRAALAGQGPGG